jgi:cytidylate kinase
MNPTRPTRDYLQIAIDGPAGSGKSTIGERVARRLGYIYVDTGAFYRTLTAVALRQRVDPEDAAALAALVERTPIRIVAPSPQDARKGRQYTVLANGVDVTDELRTLEVEAAVPAVSRHPAVRELLLVRQRELADALAVVMVGRDIGTVVLPGADLKVFLTTSLEERARRRHGDLVAKLGAEAPTLDEVREELRSRDARDATQTRIATDAAVIDNDDLSPEQTVARILALAQERLRTLQDQQDASEGTGAQMSSADSQ